MKKKTDFKLPYDVASLIPHKPPILMIDRIISIDDNKKSSVIETVVRKDFPFINEDGSLQEEALIEIMAQASAAQHGYNLKREGKKEEKGFIVGISKFEIKGIASVGDRLEISVQLGTEIESLSVVFASVVCNGSEIASTELKVWHGNGI